MRARQIRCQITLPLRRMPFGEGEIQARVERLRSELRARKLNVLLIDDCEAMAYYFN